MRALALLVPWLLVACSETGLPLARSDAAVVEDARTAPDLAPPGRDVGGAPDLVDARSGGADGPADAARDAATAPIDTGAQDVAGEPDAAPVELVACLSAGEALSLRIADTGGGAALLDVQSMGMHTCQSRYHPAEGMEPALMDLVWGSADGLLFVTVRSSEVKPGDTGTFTPFSVLISRDGTSWIGAPGKCRVTVATAMRFAEEAVSGTLLRISYRVQGLVTCDGWFPEQPTQRLERFAFTTRITELQDR